MCFKEFVKSNLKKFFLLVTCFTTLIALLGLYFKPDHTFGYESFFTPIILGAIVVLSTYIFYIKHDLSIKNTILIRLLHFFILELVLFLFGYLRGYYRGLDSVLIYIGITIILYLVMNIIIWIRDKKTADFINKGLERIRD